MSRRAPKGMSPCQSCGMSPGGCICPRHVLRGMSLVPPRPPGRSLLPACPPTVATVTCPQTDIPPAGVLPEGCSHCQHVPRGMSPMSALHYVPRMICLPPPCPKTEVPTAGVTPRGCLCCHNVPRGMYPLPWSVLKGVPPPMCPPATPVACPQRDVSTASPARCPQRAAPTAGHSRCPWGQGLQRGVPTAGVSSHCHTGCQCPRGCGPPSPSPPELARPQLKAQGGKGGRGRGGRA